MKSVLPSAGTQKAFLDSSSPYGRLDALLHSVRCIAQYEDALCELSHEVKRTGRLSEETKVELDALLKKIPSQDYVHDLDAVTVLLAETTPTPAPARKRASVPPASRRKPSN